jgi:hypothetical protein
MPTRRKPSIVWRLLDADNGRAQPPADPTCEQVIVNNPTRPQQPANRWLRNEWPALINPAF